MTFEQAVPGAAPVTPVPASAGETTTRLEQMTQALQRKIEADRAKPTRASRLDEFRAARKEVPVPPPQGAAPAPVPPSWERRQPSRSIASNVQRVPPLEAKPQPPMPPQRRRKKRLITAAVALVVAGLLFTGIYNAWDTVFPPHPSSGYNEPTVAQAQAAFATDIPVATAAPAAPQAAAPPDLSKFMPPPLPAKQAVAPPVQQAAPVPVQPQGGDPNMVARMVERGFQQDREARGAAYAPPVQNAEVPGGQTNPSTIASQPAPPPDPAAAMQRVNADYADGLLYYSEAMNHRKNGTSGFISEMNLNSKAEDLVNQEYLCSFNDRAKAHEMEEDLDAKLADLRSPTNRGSTGGSDIGQ